jgi:hypothetical protein
MKSTGEKSVPHRGRGTGPLSKERGVWVFRAGQPLPASATDKMLLKIRAERDMANLGKRE